MLLTPSNIQVAIIKAFYALAIKSVKYYTGLAIGKNNTCLFKEMRLLRAYIDILRNFEIVGSTSTCTCSVEGNYTVLLNELSEFTEAKIQFNCDGTGGMFFDNQQYPFTYGYSDVTSTLIIRFDDLFDGEGVNTILPLQDLTFQDNCSFEPNTVSPIEVAITNPVTGNPVIVNYVNTAGDEVFDWDGELFVTDETNTPVTQNVPAENLDSPTTIVNDWNSEFHPTNNGWLLNYSSATQSYTMLTPFDGINYANTYAAILEQYEGGNDSNITFEDVITIPWVTEGSLAYTELNIPDTFVSSAAPSTTITPQMISFNSSYEQANTTLSIPTNLFNGAGNKAYTLYTVYDWFFRCTSMVNQIFDGTTYSTNWYITPTADNPYLTIEDAITYINNNLSLGYEVELLNTTVITYPESIPANTSFYFPYMSFTTGDVFEISLFSPYFNTFVNVGTYTALPGDTFQDVINGIIADITAQGIFQGTVTTDFNDNIIFTAPAGTGSDWNNIYFMYIANTTAGYAYTPNFTNGNNLTENQYEISITAPEVGSLYNSYASYLSFFGYQPFENGTDSSQQTSVTVTDSLNGEIYNTDTNDFTSVDDFIQHYVQFNAIDQTDVTNIGTDETNTLVQFKNPASTTFNQIYNNQSLTFEFNKEPVSTNVYSGGLDTTEGQYAISVYDPGNSLAFYIENITITNYSSLQDLVDNINSNVDNTYVVASIVNNEIVLTTTIESSYYNNYTAYLNYDYSSTAYPPYSSNPSLFTGGVDPVANPFIVSDDINGTIFSKTLDSYNYSNVADFVADFNTNGLNYLAQVVQPGPIIPEVLATAGTSINTSSIVGGDSISVQINSTTIANYYVPSTLPSSTVMITGISNAINNSFNYNGSSELIPDSITPTGVLITAPPNTGEGYNGIYVTINKHHYVNPSVVFQFTSGALTGDSFYVSIGLFLSLPTYTASSNKTTTQLATEYAALINSTTSTNGGYTALTPAAGVLVIKAPLYTGVSGNNITAFFLTDTINNSTVANYTPQFSGGTTALTQLTSSSFQNGKNSATTTTVRFFPPPFTLTSPYTGTSNWANNNNYIYYNYDSSYYIVSDEYLHGIDTTEGELFLQLGDDPATGGSHDIYVDSINVNYASNQQLINAINNATSTNAGFSAAPDGSNGFIIYSPKFSFNYYNGSLMELAYTYRSPQYSTNNYDRQFLISDGVAGINPSLVQYYGTFQNGDIGTFVTDNPCTPTVIEQTCLTNKQVSNIIKHINKLTK